MKPAAAPAPPLEIHDLLRHAVRRPRTGQWPANSSSKTAVIVEARNANSGYMRRRSPGGDSANVNTRAGLESAENSAGGLCRRRRCGGFNDRAGAPWAGNRPNILPTAAVLKGLRSRSRISYLYRSDELYFFQPIETEGTRRSHHGTRARFVATAKAGDLSPLR